MYHIKYNPNNHVLWYINEVRSYSPIKMKSPDLPCDTVVDITLVARLPLLSVADKLCRCELGVFTGKTPVCS
jgi:hypothetical protein